MTQKNPFPLEDKVVIITGAALGIGRAAADAFAAAGSRLVLLDIQTDPLMAARDQITAAGHPRPLAVPADVASDGDLQNAVETTLEAFGRIDVLINNAGLALGGRFQDCDPARLRKVVDVNLYGLMRLTQLVIPVMLKQGTGHILNVTSQAADLAVPGYAGYVATKAGIVGLTRVLRRELEGSGIHLTLFCPGPTRTFMTERMITSGKGTAGVHHHGPELPASLMVEAVRRPRRYVITSNQPRRQALIGWVEKLFPRLLDGYWRSQISEDYFEGTALSGEE